MVPLTETSGSEGGGLSRGAALGSTAEAVACTTGLGGTAAVLHLSPGPAHQPANRPLPQGVQVDAGGRESRWGGLSSRLSVPNLPLPSSCGSLPHSRVFLQGRPSLSPSLLS